VRCTGHLPAITRSRRTCSSQRPSGSRGVTTNGPHAPRSPGRESANDLEAGEVPSLALAVHPQRDGGAARERAGDQLFRRRSPIVAAHGPGSSETIVCPRTSTSCEIPLPARATALMRDAFRFGDERSAERLIACLSTLSASLAAAAGTSMGSGAHIASAPQSGSAPPGCADGLRDPPRGCPSLTYGADSGLCAGGSRRADPAE
jgi:hypothetical protein